MLLEGQYGKAPDGWCAHRIAAGMHKRVYQLLAAQDITAIAEPTQICASTPAPAGTPVPPAPSTSLPEAPASVNCPITLEGRQVQLTLRDTDETRLLQRLAAVLKQYPLPAPPATQDRPQGQGKGWCSKHNVQMKLNHGQDGRSWYSHRTDEGRWCKGR